MELSERLEEGKAKNSTSVYMTNHQLDELISQAKGLEVNCKALVRYMRAYKAWVRVKDAKSKGEIMDSNKILAELRAASGALSQELRDEISKESQDEPR